MGIAHLSLWPLKQPYRGVIVLRGFLECHDSIRILHRHQQFLVRLIGDDCETAEGNLKFPVWTHIALGVAVEYRHPGQGVIVDGINVAAPRIDIHAAGVLQKSIVTLDHALGFAQRRSGRRIRQPVIDKDAEIVLLRKDDLVSGLVQGKAGKCVTRILDGCGWPPFRHFLPDSIVWPWGRRSHCVGTA